MPDPVTRSSEGAKGDKLKHMTVNDLLKKASKELRVRKIRCPADQNVGWLEAEVLLAQVVKKNKAWVIAHGNEHLGPILRKRFKKLVERRKNREPIAYIIGYKEFYGRPFKVNRHTLIPRPETELFIDVLKKRMKKNNRFLLWDVGTGCGEIAVTCALEFPKARIIASDICRSALRVASINAKAHKVTKRVTLVKDDLLGANAKKKLMKSGLPLVITLNLPYLPARDAKKLAAEVVGFEPEKALFGGKDGLELIKKLLIQISDDLVTLPKLILIEFDPPQSKKLRAFAKKMFPTAKIGIHNDLAGKQRLMEIRF